METNNLKRFSVANILEKLTDYFNQKFVVSTYSYISISMSITKNCRVLIKGSK